jgi:hypothetical protein
MVSALQALVAGDDEERETPRAPRNARSRRARGD